jgi:hypothetical protein
VRKQTKRQGLKQDLDWRWVVLATAVMVFVALLSIVLTRAARGLSNTMTFKTNVPTRFSPDSTFFCNMLQQPGGLQKLVESVGQRAFGQATAPNTSLLTLAIVTGASPDPTTRTAMVGLYKEVLNGHQLSSTAHQDMNPCAA